MCHKVTYDIILDKLILAVDLLKKPAARKPRQPGVKRSEQAKEYLLPCRRSTLRIDLRALLFKRLEKRY
jgi:hypothetical protein